MIFNQFEEMGNHLWHYQVTGSAIAEVFEAVKRPGDRLSGACFRRKEIMKSCDFRRGMVACLWRADWNDRKDCLLLSVSGFRGDPDG